MAMETWQQQERREVEVVQAKIAGSPRAAVDVNLSFGLPKNGWLLVTLASGDQRIDWWQTDVGDPFAIGFGTGGEIEHTFLPWLERIAAGAAPALALDIEGPFAIIVVAAQDDRRIRVSANAPGHALLDVSIDRQTFVRQFYDALVTLWESDAFIAAWSQWGGSKERWSIRSNVIEKALA